MKTGYFLTEPTDRAPTQAAGCLDDEAAEDAFRSELVLLRVYENKGLPDPALYAQAGVAFALERWRDGQRVALQGLNEVNNPFEGTGLDPARYRDWFARWIAEVRAREPGLECWWAPMSPGLDPLPWFDGCEAADGVVLHAYGLSVDELMGHVRAFTAAHPTARWMLGETNYGPGEGRTCDRDAWAHEVLAPCLDECSALGAEAVLYFVYSGWEQDDASVGQDTPLDAQGTAIDTVVRDWEPPDPFEPPPDPLTEIGPLNDLAWAHLDALQALAGDYEDAGWPSTASGIASGAEALKALIRAVKSER